MEASFKLQLQFLDLALATSEEEYRNPLLTHIKLIFADDKPNKNKEGISQEEFPNLIRSMTLMPIKANYSSEEGLAGHDGAVQIGVIKAGQQEGNKIVAIGALYNDEYPEVINFFKKEAAEGRSIEFSWELRYKDAEEIDGVSWLRNTSTKAITAVKHPAYDGRTPLLSLSNIRATEFLEAIDKELKRRATEPVGV